MPVAVLISARLAVIFGEFCFKRLKSGINSRSGPIIVLHAVFDRCTVYSIKDHYTKTRINLRHKNINMERLEQAFAGKYLLPIV